MEVHSACFGESDSDSQSQNVAAATTSDASQGVIVKDLFVCPDGSTLDLTDAIQKAVENKIASLNFSQVSGDPASFLAGKTTEKVQVQGLAGHDPLLAHDISFMSEESESEQESESSDMEELIGANVNSNAHKVQKSENLSFKTNFKPSNLGDLSSSSKAPAEAEPSSAKLSDASTMPPVEGIDPDLPGCKKRTATFVPDPRVVTWARDHLNDTPKSKEQLKQLEEEFIPESYCQDILSPIKNSEFILKAMQDKANIASDTIYFDRLKCERLLYKSQHLLSLSYGPFMDALTKLYDVPGANEARTLIGKGIMAVMSARHEISFARRELCRKHIRSDVYPYLYSNQPTYLQLFGGESIEEQVVKAKSASKYNQDFIHKKTKQNLNSSKSANSGGFQQGKSQNSRNQSEKNSNKGRGSFQKRRKGKGKGQAKPSATKDDTNN